MPVVKTPSLTLGMRSSISPYSLTHHHHHSRMEKGPFVRIHTPSIDVEGFYSGYDFALYEGCDDAPTSLSQWMSAGPLFTETEIFESTSQCPPPFTAPPPCEDNAIYEEPLDGNIFTWPYEGNTGYDASFSPFSESSTSSNTFSPSISIVSCSPRSEHSGLSLSPQPNLHEYHHSFGFDFTTTLPHEFPSQSTWSPACPPISHSPKSSKSHSPTPSCSSLEGSEVKSPASRDSSPLRNETDAQQQRRRFPCLILGCERRFTSQYTLKVHMEAHRPKPRSSFPCTLGCSERFSRQHDRLRHEVAKHGKICEFSCDDCGRFFSTKKTLGNHKCPVAQGGTRWVNN
ncbi:hypothetical protein B0H34DRAFT_755037 [Crassisporium funariophilum]|nr:hypothetical protein B0H34DRAFT_755037 [Crassisporium funariophilum]